MARASLPAPGYRPPTSRLDEGGRIVVRAYPEDGSPPRDFAFHTLPISRDIQLLLADGFEYATGAGGSRRTAQSADSFHRDLRMFARLLSEHPAPPENRAELHASHLRKIRQLGTKSGAGCLYSVRVALRATADLPESFRDTLFAPLASAPAAQPVASYTASELRSITRQARTQVRAAAARIRATEKRLQEWRIGMAEPHLQVEERGIDYALDYLERTGSVPRDEHGAPTGAAATKVHWLYESLFLTTTEMASMVVLLQCMTGLNLGTLLGLTAEYSRTDSGQDDEAPSAITAASKPRRGPYSSEMSVHLAGSGLSRRGADSRDDLGSAFGVYMLAHRLCARARGFARSNLLVVGHSTKRAAKTHDGLGFRSPSSHSIEVLAYIEAGSARRVPPDTRRVRKAVLQRSQLPIAHSPGTLARTYLARDPTSLSENQALVSQVLLDEVKRIERVAASASLTADDVREAASKPQEVAARFGISAGTLAELLDGKLDTVGMACVDNASSPHSPSGKPCSASFLLCLGCPCARSEPRHIPVQAALAARIESERATLGDDAWQARFGAAADRLEDLLGRQRVRVDEAKARVSAEDRALVDALVVGDLDLR